MTDKSETTKHKEMMALILAETFIRLSMEPLHGFSPEIGMSKSDVVDTLHSIAQRIREEQ